MINITATELNRFMRCNGSIQMWKKTSQQDDSGDKDEGVAAHWLIEQVHSGKFTPVELVERKSENGVYITPEMTDSIAQYVKFISGWGEVEVDTSYTDHSTFAVNGRADHAGVKDSVLHIPDFKYGWGIVDVEMNWTLISHAVGYLKQRPDTQINEIHFHVFQPRPYHPEGRHRTWKITLEEFNKLANQLYQALQNPKLDELSTSSACNYCPSVGLCPAATKAGMNSIDVASKRFVANITNEELSFLLSEMKRAGKVLKQNLKAYEELAVARISKGQIIDGYAIDKDLSAPEWNEEVTPEYFEMITGRSDLIRKTLPTPLQVIAENVQEEVVDSMSKRKEKGFKLVEIDADKLVKKMFKI